MGKINVKPKAETTKQIHWPQKIQQTETTNPPNVWPQPVSPAPIRDVWDVVGADNVPECPVDSVVMQDKMSMLLYGIFLRDDEDKASELLQKAMLRVYP